MEKQGAFEKNAQINPVTRTDYPDVDVIRVGDTYYMVSTTMYFMPGCEILRSYDLVHWEHAAFVYDRLDSTPAQRLEGEENAYGQGMWAASLRYHEGTYFVCFVANDTGKTYLYRSSSIEGPWEKSIIEGFYHDNSILFDDDGRIYIVYGNREIYLTELNEDLSAPKEGGLHRMIVKDSEESPLGYEGSHLYKINGRYYLFTINIPKGGRRTESCFSADSPEGDFTGGAIMDDDRGYHGMGVAQGGIIDTPGGKWYAMLFQDSGAVGRMPILIPMIWQNGMPVLGDNGRIPECFDTEDNRPGYEYVPLVGCDDFRDPDTSVEEISSETISGHVRCDSFGFKSRWQFNHEPDLSLIKRNRELGTVSIKTDKLCVNLVQARNVMTQRCIYPGCAGQVTVDGSMLREGDYAGLCLLESAYAFLALTRRNGVLQLVMCRREINSPSIWGIRKDKEPAEETAVLDPGQEIVTLRAEADFTMMKDTARFYLVSADGKIPTGAEIKLRFRLDHFTGVRFGLFIFSTRETGGSATFSDFQYESI